MRAGAGGVAQRLKRRRDGAGGWGVRPGPAPVYSPAHGTCPAARAHRQFQCRTARTLGSFLLVAGACAGAVGA